MNEKMEAIRETAKNIGGNTIIVGRGCGKALLTAAVAEVANEVSGVSPATLEEAIAFCNLQIKRCNVNLVNARDRGDVRAAMHLERKLSVYRYLRELCLKEVATVQAEAQEATECPVCRTHSVEPSGYCACCDRNW